MATRHGDTRLVWVDCPQEPCSARADSRSLDDLHAFAEEASAAYAGHVGVEIRERLDAFTGRWFEAHLAIGTDDAREVPSLEEELAHLRPEGAAEAPPSATP